MPVSKAKRPPIGTNPNIPIPVQRDLRTVAQYAFDASDNANAALEGLSTKVGKFSTSDLLSVSQFVSRQIAAGGQYPLDLTALTGAPAALSNSAAGPGIEITINAGKVTISLAPSGVTPGTYATGAKLTGGGSPGSVTVDKYGRITAITAAT